MALGAILDWLNGVTGAGNAFNDWWTKYGWVVWLIVILLIVVVIAWIYSKFRGG